MDNKSKTPNHSVSQDVVALSLMRAMEATNKRAVILGIDIGHSSILIARRSKSGRLSWEISYGPEDYINSRGGDRIFIVDYETGIIEKELFGQ